MSYRKNPGGGNIYPPPHPQRRAGWHRARSGDLEQHAGSQLCGQLADCRLIHSIPHVSAPPDLGRSLCALSIIVTSSQQPAVQLPVMYVLEYRGKPTAVEDGEVEVRRYRYGHRV